MKPTTPENLLHVLQHALGIEGRPRHVPAYRNHYTAVDGGDMDRVLAALCTENLLEQRQRGASLLTYSVTRTGERAARSVAWRCVVAGGLGNNREADTLCTVWAPTRAAARWQVVRSIREAYHTRGWFPDVRARRLPELDMHEYRFRKWSHRSCYGPPEEL